MIHRIYPKELERKDTTNVVMLASYVNLLLAIDGKGKLLTKPYDKRDGFSFRIVNTYVMPGLAVTTQTFCIAVDFLQLVFRNSVMLLQN